MDIVKIVGISLIALILIILLKQYKPEFAIYISLVAGVIILALVIGNLTNVINLLKDISTRSGINNKFLGILLKMTGIAILTEFAISICKDAGENAIASKVEIGSKVIIISLSVPIISNLLEVILKLMPK